MERIGDVGCARSNSERSDDAAAFISGITTCTSQVSYL